MRKVVLLTAIALVVGMLASGQSSAADDACRSYYDQGHTQGLKDGYQDGYKDQYKKSYNEAFNREQGTVTYPYVRRNHDWFISRT